jgi:uncharacterized membrane protein YvbJ
MYCPSSGNKTSATQKFCRSCGLGLEKIAQSLAEQAPTRLDEDLQKRKRRIERWASIAFVSGFTRFTEHTTELLVAEKKDSAEGG